MFSARALFQAGVEPAPFVGGDDAGIRSNGISRSVPAASPATESDADAAKAQVRFQPAHGHGLGRLLAVPAFERFVVGAYAAGAVAHFVIGGGGRVCPSWLLRCKCWGRLEAGPDNKQPACQAGRRADGPCGNTILRRAVVGYPRRDGCRREKGRAPPVGARGRPAAGCEGWRTMAPPEGNRLDQGAWRCWPGWSGRRPGLRPGWQGARCRSISERSPKRSGRRRPRFAGLSAAHVTDRTVLVQNAGRKWCARAARGRGQVQPSR